MKKVYKNKIFIITIFIFFIISFFFIKNYFFNKKEINENKIEINISLESNLPDIVDFNEQPIMWDFLNSSLGYKWDYRLETLGSFLAIMVNKKDLENEEGILYISKYYVSDIFPGLGSGIEKFKYNGIEWKSIKQNLLKNDNFPEKDWVLFISSENKNRDNWSKISELDLTNYKFNTFWTLEKLEKGLPTEWLRKEPYITLIKNKHKIDLNNKFFDKFRFNEKIKIYKKDNKNEEVIISVLKEDMFIGNDIKFKMTLEGIKAQYKSEGYDITPLIR